MPSFTSLPTYSILITTSPLRLSTLLTRSKSWRKFLASEDEAGSMSLADEDAALAETERTVARLEHGARKGMKLFQTPEPMMLALQAAALTDFGERKRRTAHP